MSQVSLDLETTWKSNQWQEWEKANLPPTQLSYPPSDFSYAGHNRLDLLASKWFNFYGARCNDHYRHHVRTKYETYIKLVVEAALTQTPGDSQRWDLIDEGTGAGFTLSEIVRELNMREGATAANVLGVDRDKSVLALAAHNLGRVKGKTYASTFHVGSGISPVPRATVITGHGVLEHLSSTMGIELLLRSQRCNACYVVHYVPTSMYEVPSFGDERLMSDKWWLEQFAPDAHSLDNDGKDLTMIWQGSYS